MEMSESLSVGGGECEADPALTGLFRSSLAPLAPLVPLVEKCLQHLRWRILSGEKNTSNVSADVVGRVWEIR